MSETKKGIIIPTEVTFRVSAYFTMLQTVEFLYQ